MKLLTHNMLMSPGTRNGYPLAIEVDKMQETEAEFNGDFMARMVEKIEYGVLLSTLASVRHAPLPKHPPQSPLPKHPPRSHFVWARRSSPSRRRFPPRCQPRTRRTRPSCRRCTTR